MLWRRIIEPATQQVSTHPLTQVLIGWDFYSDIVDDRESTVAHEVCLLRRASAAARSVRRNLSSEEHRVNLLSLGVRYDSVEDYWAHFLPLMLLECKQGIHRARETEMSSSIGDVVSKLDIKTRDDSFLINVQKYGMCNQYSQGDLALLYRPRPDPHCEHLIENFKTRYFHEFNERIFFSVKDTGANIVTIETLENSSSRPSKGVSPKEALIDGEGRPLRAPDPLEDNPHHLLAIVEGASIVNLTHNFISRSYQVSVAI